MKTNNDINKSKFHDEVIIKGYKTLISKVWKPNHFNDSHIYNIDLFTEIVKMGTRASKVGPRASKNTKSHASDLPKSRKCQ